MAIENITTDKLRRMGEKEGLVIQGCGGDLQEWIDGLNESLNGDEILLNGSKFENAYKFKCEGITCLFFPFDGVDADINKMAVWRIRTHGLFCGTWFSDFVDNRLGGFVEEQKKPMCPIIGANGNIFNIMAIASKTLKQNGMSEKVKEMCNRVSSSNDYNKALAIIMEYVEPCTEEDMTESEDFSLNSN